MASGRRLGIRSVAVFEAAKGLLVILAGFGFLALLHHDVQALGDELVGHLHLNPASRYPRIFLATLEHLSHVRPALLAIGATSYAAMRFIEAYGLWLERRWAEWFAVASGGLYIPFEIYELFRHPRLLGALALVINIGIVLFMAMTLVRNGPKDLGPP